MTFEDDLPSWRALARERLGDWKTERERRIKAEKERDEAVTELQARIEFGIATERPLTPDAITDEMVERAQHKIQLRATRIPAQTIRLALVAALTEPTRPEGAEEIQPAFETWEHAEYLNGGIDADDKRALADHIAKEMNR